MRIAICDDDLKELDKYANRLKALAEKYSVEVVVSKYSSGAALLFDVEDANKRPQILYLDIHMPVKNGVDVAMQLREMRLNVELIFLTVSREHWDKAFDLDAANYVVKDDDEMARFELAFVKAINRVEDKQAETIMLTCAGQTRSIRLRDITYFEVQRNVMLVHYLSGGQKMKFEFYSTMLRIEELVWGKGFVRTQRSFLAAVSQIHHMSYDTLTMIDGTELPVGRNYAKAVRALLSPGE